MAADFPSGLTSKALMGQAQDNISSTINQTGGLTAVATTVTLTSASAFPTSGYIRIDTETMKYTGKSSNDLTGLTRGLFGTSAAAHTNGTSVELTNSGGYIDELQEEVIALQTKVGVDFANHQANTTNSTVSNLRIQTGWGFVQGNDTVQVSEAVTFPTAFGSAPIVIVSSLGYRASDPSNIGDFTVGFANQVAIIAASSITTTGFTLYVVTDTGQVLASAGRWGYAWKALGTLA